LLAPEDYTRVVKARVVAIAKVKQSPFVALRNVTDNQITVTNIFTGRPARGIVNPSSRHPGSHPQKRSRSEVQEIAGDIPWGWLRIVGGTPAQSAAAF
jgi:NAD(P)H-dependent flavin oxidoreductase YrpB (nitropropane dioxygenase family)